MHDYNATGNYYTIGHLTLLTGLSDRTIRNYISAGILKGEKINNLWHFSPEQVETFIHHPAVRPSILAKSNALVYDFLLNTKKAAPKSCVILDCPGCGINEVTEFFCSAINADSTLHDFRFSFSSLGGTPRIILTGCPHQVLALASRWSSQQGL